MKKLLLLFLITLSISASGQTSVYHPFPDSNAYWNFHYTSYCLIGIANNDYTITIKGDTSINSNLYHKLITPFVESTSVGDCFEVQVGYKGAIRQDTTLRKVYFVPPDSNSEQLLYDFNMQLGDTVKGYIETDAYQPDTVISIDSVQVGGNYHKRWKINNNYQIYLIEGIGSVYGLIEKSPTNNMDFPNYILNCFSMNGQSLYPSTATSCQLINTVNENNNIADKVNIYPNPFTTNLTFQLPELLPDINLSLYDVYSRLVSTTNASNTNKITLQNTNLPKGIYFYRLTSKNNDIKTGKVIKLE